MVLTYGDHFLLKTTGKSGIFQGTVNETLKVDFIGSKGLNQNGGE